MPKRKNRIPNIGDHVAVIGQKGAFVVSRVDSSLSTVELKMIAHTLALTTIPWRALTFLDELDESQTALRIMRESTDGK
jgi:hypothetical protein